MKAPIEDINAQLGPQMAALAVALLGEPTERSGTTWRWGRKGSLAVVVDGAKRGVWRDRGHGGAGSDTHWQVRNRCGGIATMFVRTGGGGALPERWRCASDVRKRCSIEWFDGYRHAACVTAAPQPPRCRQARRR